MTRDVRLELVDLAKLRARFDNDEELLEEIFRVFLSEVPERRSNILAALAAGDLDRLSRLAHSLKGVSGTMYAETLRQAAYDVEKAAKERDGAQAAALAADLLDGLQQLAEELKRFLEA